MRIKNSALSLILLLSFCSSKCSSGCKCDPCDENEYTSQSFMFTRPLMQNLPARNTSWNNIMHTAHGDILSSVQILGMYQQSMENEDNARYFLINHKTCLHVAGDNSTLQNDRDIRAEWIGLPSDFSGKFSICPAQRKMGFLFEYNQKFKKYFEASFFKNYWLTISAPLVSVENDLQMEQFDVHNTATGSNPHDILDALCQDEWLFGKICNCQRSTIQLAHIKITLGSTYMSENNFLLSYYSHLHLVTAPRDCGHYMFDAIVGTNGHHGMGAGVNMQIVMNKDNGWYDACFFIDLEHTFLFRRKQMRTLDIKGKPWSRYMLYNQIDRGPDLKIPGVNILTREVKAHPYSMVDFSTGIRVKSEYTEIEVGYGIWGHGDEKLELVCPFPEIYGIAGTPDGDDPTTASASCIKTQAANDVDSESATEFVPVLKEDLCLPFKRGIRSAINHRVHFSFAATHVGQKVDGSFSLGVFYELPQRNSALKVWGLWGKAAASF